MDAVPIIKQNKYDEVFDAKLRPQLRVLFTEFKAATDRLATLPATRQLDVPAVSVAACATAILQREYDRCLSVEMACRNLRKGGCCRK